MDASPSSALAEAPVPKASTKSVENPDEGENGVPQSVDSLVMEAVEELSIVVRILERWTYFSPSVGVSEEHVRNERAQYDENVRRGKLRVAEHLRRFIRKTRRILAVCGSQCLDDVNVAVDLITHVDSFMSPNLWMRALFEETEYMNNVARGEQLSLGALHATIRLYFDALNELQDASKYSPATVKVPDFSEASKPPTVLRSPVLASDDSIDITDLLRLLRDPLEAESLGGNLRIQ